MVRTGAKRFALIAALAVALPLGGCVYYNTFFNAKEAFRSGEKARLDAEKRLAGLSSRSVGPPGARGNIAGDEYYRTAIEKSAKVLAYYPHSQYVDDALLLMAKCYYRLAEYNASLRKCEELLTSFPNSPLVPEVRYWRGMCLWNLDKTQDATTALETIADSHSPYRGNAAFALAELKRSGGELDDAIKYYRLAISSAREPGFREQAYDSLGDCFLEAGRPGDAAHEYATLAKLQVTSAKQFDAYVKEAGAQREMGDYDAAMATLKPLLTNERYNDFVQQTRIELAKTHEAKGEIEAAVLLYQKVLDEAARQQPTRYQPTSRSGKDQGPTIPVTPETVDASYRLGRIQEMHYHRYDKAVQYYDFASQDTREPAGMKARDREAALRTWSQLRSALNDTSKSGPQTPKDQAYYDLAQHFLLNLGETDSALTYFQTVVDSCPGSRLSPKAQYAEGWIWLNERGDTARADSAWQPLLQDTTVTPLLVVLRRDVRGALGVAGPDEARPIYREASDVWMDALESDPAQPPDSLVMDSSAAGGAVTKAWWRAWAQRQRDVADTSYVPMLKRVVAEYPDSPYAGRARYILGWYTENVLGDSTAASGWYESAAADSAWAPEAAKRADDLLALRSGVVSAGPGGSAGGAAADTTGGARAQAASAVPVNYEDSAYVQARGQ